MKKLFLVCLLILLYSTIAKGETTSERFVRVLRTNSTKCLSKRSKVLIPSCKKFNTKVNSKPTGYCYRYVKIALYSSGLTSAYMRGRYAKNAGKALEREGFKNIIDRVRTVYNAPLGSVLVYSGGRYGHIEVRTGVNEYVSDYVGTKPIMDQLDLKRVLTGVYVKTVGVMTKMMYGISNDNIGLTNMLEELIEEEL